MTTDSVGPLELARRAFASAELYERVRPGYAPAAIALLVHEFRLGPGATVVDVGAGTGQLIREFALTGGRLVAIEPVEAMRLLLRRVVPAVATVAGMAEALPLRKSSVDLVVAGEAFQWFSPFEAAAEFERIVRPRGGVALLWNVIEQSSPWVTAFAGTMRAGSPRRTDEPLVQGFEHSAGWEPIRTERFPNDQVADIDTLVGRVASTSGVMLLPPSDREALLSRARAILLEAHPDAAENKPIRLPQRTELYWTRRR